MKLELRPCPFCGGEACALSISVCELEELHFYYFIVCCDCSAEIRSSSEEGSAAAWNLRASERTDPGGGGSQRLLRAEESRNPKMDDRACQACWKCGSSASGSVSCDRCGGKLFACEEHLLIGVEAVFREHRAFVRAGLYLVFVRPGMGKAVFSTTLSPAVADKIEIRGTPAEGAHNIVVTAVI